MDAASNRDNSSEPDEEIVETKNDDNDEEHDELEKPSFLRRFKKNKNKKSQETTEDK